MGFGLYCEPEARLALSWSPGRWTDHYKKIAPAVDTFPGFLRERLLQEFDRRAPLQWLGEAEQSAPDWLRAITDDLVAAHLAIGFDSDEISARAARFAHLSSRARHWNQIAIIANGFDLPMPNGETRESAAKRAYEPRAWRRIMESVYTRGAENKLRAIGFIARREQLYCTDLALQWFRGKMRAQVEYLKSHAVECDGEQLSLFDVRERSVSSPAIRRAELMTRMSGFESIAKDAGHHAEFITLTAPSKFHATLATGEPNPAYQGATVRDAQAWLSKMWTRSRSKLARLSILVYGFRIAEPHHDGTPHWHMVLFARKSDLGSLRAVLRGYWLSECGSEAGALSHRITFQSIDPLKGSATGYIAKYVAKNIDGFEVGPDYEAMETAVNTAAPMGESLGAQIETGAGIEKQIRANASDTAARVRAWASLHGIRQFQQIGGPPVTLYRELRRIRRPAGGSGPSVDVVAIERARVPADAGDWAGYVASVGGIEAGRDTTVQLWKELTGECNAYSECKGPQIVGIVARTLEAADRVRTHEKVWRIVRVLSESSLGPVSITVRDGLSLANPHGWTNPNETSMYGPN